jgi:hypothetical protein
MEFLGSDYIKLPYYEIVTTFYISQSQIHGMKKAQIASHMFVYILALVIIGLIALIGFKGIGGFIERARVLELANFKESVRTQVYETRDVGEQRFVQTRLPKGFIAVCFHDPAQPAGPAPFQRPIVEGYSGTHNAFLIRYEAPITSQGVEPFNISRLVLSQRYSCIPTNDGIVEFKLAGAGRQGTSLVP